MRTRKRTKEQFVEQIINAADKLRLDCDGGYPSQYLIEHGKVYWANFDHDGDISLIDLSIEEFIEKFRFHLEDLEEWMEGE